MANWTYEIVIQGDVSLKTGGTCTAVIRRTSPASVSDIGLYSISGSSGTWLCDVTENVYLSKYRPTLAFGSYGWVQLRLGAASGDAVSSDSGTFYDVSSSILNVGTSGETITVYEDDASTGMGTHVRLRNTVFTITINVVSKYDTSTFSCGSPIDFGGSSSVSFSNSKLSELKHKVTWQISSTYTNTLTTGTGATSASYQIPTSWLASCPDKTSIDCTVTVETMYGSNSIGTASKVISLSVPTNIKPSIGSLTAAIYNDKTLSSFATNRGIYLQTLTGVKLIANSVTAGTGSSIQSYAFSSTSEDVGTTSSNTYTIAAFGHSGTMRFTVTVTDKRGRQSSAECTIDVIPYSSPVISTFDAYRCTSSGTGSENGTYAQIRCAASVSSVKVSGVERNSMSIKSYYYVSTTGTPSLISAISDMTSGSSYVIGGGNLSTSSTYYARFVVTDAVGGTAQVDTLISSAAYAIHVKNGGTGVAFGKTSEISNSVEINPGWSFYYQGFLMAPVVYSATDEPKNPVTGLIWLKKK